MKRILNSFSPVFLFFVLSIHGAYVLATTPLDLTISPITISIETDPGASVSSEMKIHNNGSEPEQLKLSLGTFKADSTGERPELMDFKPEDEFSHWIHLGQDMITVNPGEWKTVPFTFLPSQTAAFSYFYTIIVSRQSEVAPNGNGSVVVSGSPAVLVLATVRSPSAKRELQFSSLSTNSLFSEFLPVEFTVNMKNTGNVHIVPTGDIFIDGMGKKGIAIIPINAGGSSILPGTSRAYRSSWDDGFPVFVEKIENEKKVKDDKNNPVMSLHWDFSKVDRLRFGKYTAHMILVYDNGERDVPIEASVSFWVVPVRLIVGILAVPILRDLLVYILMKRGRK